MTTTTPSDLVWDAPDGAVIGGHTVTILCGNDWTRVT